MAVARFDAHPTHASIAVQIAELTTQNEHLNSAYLLQSAHVYRQQTVNLRAEASNQSALQAWTHPAVREGTTCKLLQLLLPLPLLCGQEAHELKAVTGNPRGHQSRQHC